MEDKKPGGLMIVIGDKKQGPPPPLKPLKKLGEKPEVKPDVAEKGGEETMEEICELVRKQIAPDLEPGDYVGTLKALKEHLEIEPEEGKVEDEKEPE